MLFLENPNPTPDIDFMNGAIEAPVPVAVATHCPIPELKARLNEPHWLKRKHTLTEVPAGHGSWLIERAIVPNLAFCTIGTTSQRKSAFCSFLICSSSVEV